MSNNNQIKFASQKFSKRILSMIKVDLRRMLTMPLFYLMAGISLVIPILVLVMTTMMGDTTISNPSTNVTEPMATFTNVWQIIGTSSDSLNQGQGMSMDLTTMCNINLVFFLLGVAICIFVSDDFRSGYSKNLFTNRSKKIDYVISKTCVGFFLGVMMLLSFFIGALIGGGISNLSFDLGSVSVAQVVCCLLSKIFLLLVFVAIFLVMSVVGKQRLWLSIMLSLGASMLLFNMIPSITPLDSTFLNVILCLVGGIIFSVGIGLVSKIVLDKTSVL